MRTKEGRPYDEGGVWLIMDRKNRTTDVIGSEPFSARVLYGISSVRERRLVLALRVRR